MMMRSVAAVASVTLVGHKLALCDPSSSAPRERVQRVLVLTRHGDRTPAFWVTAPLPFGCGAAVPDGAISGVCVKMCLLLPQLQLILPQLCLLQLLLPQPLLCLLQLLLPQPLLCLLQLLLPQPLLCLLQLLLPQPLLCVGVQGYEHRDQEL